MLGSIISANSVRITIASSACLPISFLFPIPGLLPYREMSTLCDYFLYSISSLAQLHPSPQHEFLHPHQALPHSLWNLCLSVNTHFVLSPQCWLFPEGIISLTTPSNGNHSSHNAPPLRWAYSNRKPSSVTSQHVLTSEFKTIHIHHFPLFFLLSYFLALSWIIPDLNFILTHVFNNYAVLRGAWNSTSCLRNIKVNKTLFRFCELAFWWESRHIIIREHYLL